MYSNRFSKVKILCIGDIILDCFASGAVDKISPEAPIPIFKLNKKKYILGGVANVARNISSGGGHCYLISVIGKDIAGKKIMQLLRGDKKIEPFFVTDPERMTTIKTRFVSGPQQILRVDDEKDIEINKTVENKILNIFKKKLINSDLVILSDYSKGLLTRNLIKVIINLSKKAKKLIIVDPKKSDFSIYKGADIITPNSKELLNATRQIALNKKTNPKNEEDLVSYLSKNLLKENNFKTVITTRSSKGMLICSKDKQFSLSSQALEVFDVSGAGDTVVAYLALGISSGLSLKDAAYLSNKAAGVAVGKFGTAAVDYFELNKNNEYDKKITLSQATQLLRNISKEKKIGFTNGCFDLLHAGHLKFLLEARKKCDYLILGLNSDTSIKLLKGKHRPITNQNERVKILSLLPFVDSIIIFNEMTPLNLIRKLKPNLLFKGKDYIAKDVVGNKDIRSWGGKVVLIDYIDGYSTTKFIKRIKNGT